MAYSYAHSLNCDLVIAPELAISSYNIRDLALNKDFLQNNQLKLHELSAMTRGKNQALLLGHLSLAEQREKVLGPVNAASFIENGWVIHSHIKQHLANYDIFDEERIFRTQKPDLEMSASITQPQYKILRWRNIQIGLMICEDMWYPDLAEFYTKQMKANSSAEMVQNLFIVINASPYSIDKVMKRQEVAQALINKYGIPLIYVNQFGGQDNLVFDGGSFIVNHDGIYELEPVLWFEGVIVLDLTLRPLQIKKDTIRYTHSDYLKKLTTVHLLSTTPLPEQMIREPLLKPLVRFDNPALVREEKRGATNREENNIYQAIVQATKDYVQKNNFQRVVLGLSGGIDSALVATIACDALGSEKVRCLALPSEYSSSSSLTDAQELCARLNCHLDIAPINLSYETLKSTLTSILGELSNEITTENLQARIRGIILMAVSNKHDALLLCCSNKSESAIGYTTIYGDACGAFAPIADLYKTQIYRLAHLRNVGLGCGLDNQTEICLSIIPQAILEKEPSAELRPNQKDRDYMLPYDQLDRILYYLIEQDLDPLTVAFLTTEDFLEVKRIYTLLLKQEFKRQQFPCFPKISKKPLTYGRRYPLTNRYQV